MTRPPGLKHWLPLGFVIALLFALVSIPVFSERRIRGYERALNETVEPARAAVTDLLLARGVAGGALREFLTGGENSERDRYAAAIAEERRALDALAPLVAVIGQPAAAEYDALRSAVLGWREDVETLLGDPEHDPAARLSTELNEQALIAAARLDRELARAAESLRLQVSRSKQRDVEVAALFLILAVIAALVVGWAGRQLHRSAVAAERARLDLLRVNESRARLIRGFSHDVKNPLSGADGYAQLLQQEILGDLTEQQARGVDRLRTSLHAALGLIDDLVDLARAEAGQIDLHVGRFDLLDVARELTDEYDAAAAAKQLSLCVVAAARSAPIASDRSRVRQILSNLFSNAVKYTPEGGTVTVDVGWAPARRDPDPQRWALVSVEDTGPGIPRDQQHLLFREFTRLDPEGSRGAGLGLAISQGLAHALGGKITVRSDVGRGSTFTLWLPDAPAAAVD